MTAQDIWSTLQKHHIHQGPMSQITFLCILMLLGLSSDESLSAVCDSIISSLSSATSEHPYTSTVAIAQTVSVPAEAHIA